MEMTNREYSEEEMRNFSWKKVSLTYKGKRYAMSRMSYGDYFMEPTSWKGGETDGFSPDVVWFVDKIITNKYGVKQKVYTMDI